MIFSFQQGRGGSRSLSSLWPVSVMRTSSSMPPEILLRDVDAGLNGDDHAGLERASIRLDREHRDDMMAEAVNE